ncbi:MAG: hypothetical protein ABI321_10825 [Polyangia bacterium]
MNTSPQRELGRRFFIRLHGRDELAARVAPGRRASRTHSGFDVLDARTGHNIQQVTQPEAPDVMLVRDNQLFVRIYDGYAVFPLL